MQVWTTSSEGNTWRFMPRSITDADSIIAWGEREHTGKSDLFFNTLTGNISGSWIVISNRDIPTYKEGEFVYLRVFKVGTPGGLVEQIREQPSEILANITHNDAFNKIVTAFDENELSEEIYRGKVLITDETPDLKYSIYADDPMSAPPKPNRSWLTT